MSGDFAAKFIWASCAFLFVYSLAGQYPSPDVLSTLCHCSRVIYITYNNKFCLAYPEAVVWVFCKKVALKTYTELTEKHHCWSLFLINFQGFRLVNLLKRDSKTGVCFPVDLVKFLRAPILENICKLLLLHIKYYTPSNNTVESVAEYS